MGLSSGGARRDCLSLFLKVKIPSLRRPRRMGHPESLYFFISSDLYHASQAMLHAKVVKQWRGTYNHSSMTVTVRSFAKINLGLRIGAAREDGFHELLTVYQTIALHDVIRVSVERGSGIEIHCEDPRVPKDESNTCFRIVEKALEALRARGRVVVEIEKRLPVQGGLGGASANAGACLVALERALKKQLPAEEQFRIAAEVGSDVPLFLVGGTVLGVGRGEQVYPLPDLPAMACVVVTPEVGVSTPKAFAEWDRLCGAGAAARGAAPLLRGSEKQQPAELRSAGQPRAAVPTKPGTDECVR